MKKQPTIPTLPKAPDLETLLRLKAEVEACVDYFDRRAAPFVARSNQGRRILGRIAEGISDIKVADADWQWIIDHPEGLSDAAYKRSKEMAEQIGVQMEGYFRDTGQRVAKFDIPYKDANKVDIVAKAIRFLLPFYRPLKDGTIRFSIFEHTLSEWGVYTLRYHTDGREEAWDILLTRYSRDEVQKTFSTLHGALTYISEHHYYPRRRDAEGNGLDD